VVVVVVEILVVAHLITCKEQMEHLEEHHLLEIFYLLMVALFLLDIPKAQEAVMDS
jgi:hypothetical protein